MDMLTLFNGRERDADDWKHLLRLADSKFKLLEIKQPQGSTLALIIATWIEESPNHD